MHWLIHAVGLFLGTAPGLAFLAIPIAWACQCRHLRAIIVMAILLVSYLCAAVSAVAIIIALVQSAL